MKGLIKRFTWVSDHAGYVWLTSDCKGIYDIHMARILCSIIVIVLLRSPLKQKSETYQQLENINLKPHIAIGNVIFCLSHIW